MTEVTQHLRRRARKIARETGLAVVVGGVDASGVHLAWEGAEAGEVEYVAMHFLRMLENQLADNVSECEACAARWRRVSTAAAILAEGFNQDGAAKGSC